MEGVNYSPMEGEKRAKWGEFITLAGIEHNRHWSRDNGVDNGLYYHLGGSLTRDNAEWLLNEWSLAKAVLEFLSFGLSNLYLQWKILMPTVVGEFKVVL